MQGSGGEREELDRVILIGFGAITAIRLEIETPHTPPEPGKKG